MTPPRTPETLYAYESITKEIESFASDAPRGTKARLARAAGMDPSAFRHRMIQRQNQRFSFEEIGQIAMEAGRIMGRLHGAPLGWPFIPWKDAEELEALRRVLRSTKG
jgi:hypothetical protein